MWRPAQTPAGPGRLSCQLYQRSARHLPRRALRHRQLRAAPPRTWSAQRCRPGRRRLHLDRWRLPHLPATTRTRWRLQLRPHPPTTTPRLHIKRKPELRSSTTSTKTLRFSTISVTRPSKPPWRFDEAQADLCARGQWCHWPQQLQCLGTCQKSWRVKRTTFGCPVLMGRKT